MQNRLLRIAPEIYDLDTRDSVHNALHGLGNHSDFDGDNVKESHTKEYYDSHSEEYFRTTYKADLQPIWQKLAERLAPTSASILDLGCGSGRDLRYFSQLGFQTVGVDYSPNLVKLARAFSGQRVVLGDFASLPFENNTFDAAWAIGSLVHVSRTSLPFVLSEIHRVLKENAYLLTSVKEGAGEEVDACGRYNVFHSAEEWANAHLSTGYEVLDVYSTVEGRKTQQNSVVEIPWVVCLARTRQRDMHHRVQADQED